MTTQLKEEGFCSCTYPAWSTLTSTTTTSFMEERVRTFAAGPSTLVSLPLSKNKTYASGSQLVTITIMIIMGSMTISTWLMEERLAMAPIWVVYSTVLEYLRSQKTHTLLKPGLDRKMEQFIKNKPKRRSLSTNLLKLSAAMRLTRLLTLMNTMKSCNSWDSTTLGERISNICSSNNEIFTHQFNLEKNHI